MNIIVPVGVIMLSVRSIEYLTKTSDPSMKKKNPPFKMLAGEYKKI